ncbi:hypothetical protein FAZ78_05300 [Cereibacter changlensis]|uniref:Uncharacterized protein n=1 Tax=Cereibacter changlensis TaxID=402884 RepID=A0A4U0Z517_9RHOB|nr:hypothetical protein [Cereibacter changlensis]TKA97604.1 hypothetical protein FAZ78_05300 [Cereibacter changlensis]
MLMLLAASVALTVAMTLVPQVFSAVASAVEAVTGRKTVFNDLRVKEARVSGELERTTRELDIVRQRAIKTELNLRLEREAHQKVVLQLEEARLVSYRGERIPLRDAVHDTSTRISDRVARATARNVGSTFGEGLPFVGIGIIVAATAWELKDACDMMKEMRELDAAFNPDRAIKDDEICGITPPTKEEIWQTVSSSPSAAWENALETYDDLPDLQFSVAYEWTISKLATMFTLAGDEATDSVFPVTPEVTEASSTWGIPWWDEEE